MNIFMNAAIVAKSLVLQQISEAKILIANSDSWEGRKQGPQSQES